MSLSQEEVIHCLFSDRAKLISYIRAIVLSQQTAEDIHQDVVVEALRKAETFVDSGHLLAWARQAAKLRAFSYLKRQKQHPRVLDPELLELLEPVWESESKTPGPAMMEALGECLKELSPRSRELVDLRFGDELNGSQMSAKLGIKVPSVYMALSRVYRMLDDCVRRKLAETG
ncbi:MAG: sigma-70 family RNA polymerase sigma factor [Pirellulaceae bacterium]|nr:sigma-70 family RNA polymerase sigma factor [Pirellulaceae bacterium]